MNISEMIKLILHTIRENKIMDRIQEARKKSPLGKIPQQYYLAKSKNIIDKHGERIRGLFTRKYIRKGMLLGEYRGKIFDKKILGTKKKYTQYMFSVSGKKGNIRFIIDAANTRYSSFPKFINAPNNERYSNTEYIQVLDSILLYSLKAIKPNTELVAWYGENTISVINQK